MFEAELRAVQVSAPDTEPADLPVPVGSVTDNWDQAADVVAVARRRLHDTLQQWNLTDLADDSALVLSELLTNAVQHAHGPGQTVKTQFSRLADGRGVRIEVHDADPRHLPIVQADRDSSEDVRGRGLRLVANCTAERWGVVLSPNGKSVWGEVTR